MTHVRAHSDLKEKMRIGRALLDQHGLEHWDFEVCDLYDGEHHRGCAHLQQHIISIDIRMGRDFRQVVLHEIAHALRGLSLGHDREWLEVARNPYLRLIRKLDEGRQK